MIRTLRLSASDFSLRHTLECGQAFRWRPANGGYYGFLPVRAAASGLGSSCAAKVRQQDDALIVETIDPRLTSDDVRWYFALDLDLARVLASIDADAQIHDAITRFRGLRVLRQDSWECLASFILSSFNNIKRIQGMIDRLSAAYGAPAAFNGFRGCAFPTPERIASASEPRLRELGLGFRAPYLKATARLIADGRLSFDTLRRAEYLATKTALLHCDGVGEKVADCVALFGFEKYQAFPVDVWMERAMRYYFRRRRTTPKRIHEFASRHFGPYAGYAQQYLYHYVRSMRKAVGSQQSTASAPLGYSLS